LPRGLDPQNEIGVLVVELVWYDQGSDMCQVFTRSTSPLQDLPV
jgi:hypothetical protein